MAALFDTTVGVLLLRRKRPPETAPLIDAAKSEIERGSALLPAMAVSDATGVWLGLPLLTWDGDYARSRARAVTGRSSHPGAELWRALVLHPASRPA